VKRTAKIDPVQEWGEEEEEGAVFGITLRREPVLPGPDSPEPPTAFSFVQYHTVKVRRLKAATLERLITHLLDPEHQEPDFVPVFLSTYRAFTSASSLIQLLFQSAAELIYYVFPVSFEGGHPRDEEPTAASLRPLFYRMQRFLSVCKILVGLCGCVLAV
uniref:Ral guanine nucleotide dissociation stimulator-like 3a n=1 Tax=Salarias fasciatus TaxID=181472 RepID=A0A672IQI4_SALFA